MQEPRSGERTSNPNYPKKQKAVEKPGRANQDNAEHLQVQPWAQTARREEEKPESAGGLALHQAGEGVPYCPSTEGSTWPWDCSAPAVWRCTASLGVCASRVINSQPIINPQPLTEPSKLNRSFHPDPAPNPKTPSRHR